MSDELNIDLSEDYKGRTVYVEARVCKGEDTTNLYEGTFLGLQGLGDRMFVTLKDARHKIYANMAPDENGDDEERIVTSKRTSVPLEDIISIDLEPEITE